MEQRLAEQKEQHHGGNKWIGTGGTTAFGHSGMRRKASGCMEARMSRSALKVAGERNYRDFREDKVLQPQAVPDSPAQAPGRFPAKDDGARTELNADETIEDM